MAQLEKLFEQYDRLVLFDTAGMKSSNLPLLWWSSGRERLRLSKNMTS